MICDRCSRPIAPADPVTTIPVDTPTGAVPDLVVHARPCRPDPERPTAPVRIYR
ncbi:hypothetical protein AB0465_02960 [Streptomyces griseoviridis]|uniref:Uncharacterized protein n=1 Tax=Streptomyces hintoniae TaxID=3075521 RepID=A0ABU2ULF8_9ACTN|nr:hypothetical protein [Streptomyces sp. DSM 41014]MDH6699562.1 hypothetical protein [Streptomyces sp. MAA16]MDT0474109.1 hypothetical protein [Streptomyces sp. DSM 41014]